MVSSQMSRVPVRFFVKMAFFVTPPIFASMIENDSALGLFSMALA